jgi:hypothetical protein
VRDFRQLGLHHLLGQVNDGLELGARENEDLVRPLVILDVVDLVLPLGHDAEIVTRASVAPWPPDRATNGRSCSLA